MIVSKNSKARLSDMCPWRETKSGDMYVYDGYTIEDGTEFTYVIGVKGGKAFVKHISPNNSTYEWLETKYIPDTIGYAGDYCGNYPKLPERFMQEPFTPDAEQLYNLNISY